MDQKILHPPHEWKHRMGSGFSLSGPQ
jgi:hypothetical protein